MIDTSCRGILTFREILNQNWVDRIPKSPFLPKIRWSFYGHGLYSGANMRFLAYLSLLKWVLLIKIIPCILDPFWTTLSEKFLPTCKGTHLHYNKNNHYFIRKLFAKELMYAKNLQNFRQLYHLNINNYHTK